MNRLFHALLGAAVLIFPLQSAEIAPNTEPLGPSSRKTPFAITEIQYKPAPRTDGKVLEFIEIYNSNPFFENLSGFRLSGDIEYTFPPGTILQGTNFIVVAKVPADVTALHGITNVTGPYTGSLKTSGTIELINRSKGVALTVPYSAKNPWPVAADGSGHSLVLARPSYGEGDPYAWDISDVMGGSPGTNEVYHASPLRNIVINEILAHSLPPLADYVELYNHSTQEVDLSGAILTDDLSTNKFVVPAGTKIAAAGYLSFDETQLGFGLSGSGETLYFINPDHSRILDALQFEAQEQGVAFGRSPDGTRNWDRLRSRTPGQKNAAPLVSEVVINEIMYAPISGNTADEYIELYNAGTKAVDLSGWEFTSGINFTMPAKTTLAAGGYLVVAKDTAHLQSNYTTLNAQNTVGNFSGSLAGRGELIALAKPEVFISTNKNNQAVTNINPVVVEAVRYQAGGPWGNWSHEGGSSLELKDPRANRRLGANWADSDETAKSQWTTIEATGKLDLGGGKSPDELHVMLHGEGEALLDNVEVFTTNLVNRITNSTFEGSLGGWIPRGNHVRSTLETNGGFESEKSLHIRASARGDTGANRIFSRLIPSLTANQIVTIKAKARWLRGWPELLMRIHGNYFEATGPVPYPKNLGTPGARNSASVDNSAPAIYDVTHFPIVPLTNDTVLVTARVDDPDGITTLVLNYRYDPINTVHTVNMVDDGTGGDLVAGDGLFSAQIPPVKVAVVVAFTVDATDSKGLTARFPTGEATGAPVRECVFRFGDAQPNFTFATYRQWYTKTNIDYWTKRPILSNERVEGTFVYNNIRAVYNVGGKFSGSPYHQSFSTGPLSDCHYSLEFPLDDIVLGTENFNKIHAPGNGPFDDDSIQREQACYWLAAAMELPWNYRRYVAMYVNGTRKGRFMEDSQTPGSDVVEQYFPNNTDGQLFKIQPWFEMSDAAQGAMDFVNVAWTELTRYLSGGQYKTARERWNFLVRAAQGTANNYTNVFNLIDAANKPNGLPFVTAMNNLIDVEEWMRIFAVEHASGNWDSFGAQNSQNMYGYKPQNGKWRLMIWDWNIVLGNSGSWTPGEKLTFVNDRDAVTPKFYNATNALTRRAFWRGLKELATVHFTNPEFFAMMDAKYAVFRTNGATVAAPTSIKTWINQARTSILGQVKPNDTPLFTIRTFVPPSDTDNLATVTGGAPIEVKTIKVNGTEYPITWTTVTNFSIKVPVTGTNVALILQAYGVKGDVLTDLVAATNATFSGSVPNPEGNVVINEILYNPLNPGSEFVELYNRSSTFTFDLSGYSVNGLSYTFPAGSFIQPNEYLVLAKERFAFAGNFPTVNLFDAYDGNLDLEGETLTLERPDATLGSLVVSRVRYSPAAPWAATTPGTSLQLIDPSLDNSRPGAWATSATIQSTPSQANAVSGPASAFPKVWLNEVEPDGSFTDAAGHKEPWIEIYNSGTEAVSLANLSLSVDAANLSQWQFPAGAQLAPGEFKVLVADGAANESTATQWHTSFRLPAASGMVTLSRTENGSTQVLDYLSYGSLPAGASYAAIPNGQASVRLRTFQPTPGAANIVPASTTPVLINEWMASNTQTITDPADGNYDDWFELYNAGTTAVDLSGFYLTDNRTNKTQFRIPAGYSIPAGGYLLVWADSDTGQNDTNHTQLHINFKLSKTASDIGLFSAEGTTIDLVQFGAQTSDVAEGRSPDGSNTIGALVGATPGTKNAGLSSAGGERFTQVTVSAAQLNLTWNASAGASYQLEYKANLQDAMWTSAGAAIQANGATVSTTQPLSSSRRFYRFRKL